MTVEVEINEISRESWTGKDGKTKEATRLVCVDKDPNAISRFKGDLVVGLPSDQTELVSQRLRRDMRVKVELTGSRVFGSQMAFDGRLIPESIPAEKQAVGGKS